MQRVWRSKFNKEIIQLMEESVDIRLYLVQEKGPLSFVFQDDSKKSYTITIGGSITCSCGGGRKEHCVHTLYVLNRIFKIQFNDALILQLNYTDQELGKMISARTSEQDNKKTLRKKRKNDNDNEENEEENSNIRRMNLYDDQTCPICQEFLYKAEGLFVCSDSCGHNFHINCLKVWADHKKNTSDIISCPMCRAQWNEDDLKKSLVKQMGEKVLLKAHRGINCKICSRTNIKAERFHCLICSNFDICIECYSLNKHNSDHYFIVKKAVDEKWLGVETIKNKLQDEVVYNIKNIKLSQFLVSLLKDQERNQINNQINYANSIVGNNEEEIVVNEENIQSNILENNKCVVCNSNRSSSLQLLKFKKLFKCHHLVHFKCSESLFKLYHDSKSNNYSVDTNFNICKIDKSEIFPGLTSLNLKIKTENSINNSNMINSNIENKNIIDNKSIFQDFLVVNSASIGINKSILNSAYLKSKAITPLYHRSQKNHTYNNNLGLTLNIQKVNFENQDLNMEKENTNKNRLKNIRKLYSNRPIRRSNKKEEINNTNKVNEDFIIKNDNNMNTNNIDQVEINNAIIHYDPKLNKMNSIKNKGIRVVDLKIMEFKLSPLMSQGINL